MRPICMKCKVEMCCMDNNFPIRDPAVGNFPSTLWFGDLWMCLKCGVEIVSGRGKGRITEEHPEATQFSYR